LSECVIRVVSGDRFLFDPPFHDDSVKGWATRIEEIRDMRPFRKLSPVLHEAAKAAVTGALCGLLVALPAVGEMPASGSISGGVVPTARNAPLTQQERVLQTLNRFTFGPRPGDVAAVEKMGLDRWFELQLHPDRIDDAAFEDQMQSYPAMQLSTSQLMRRFPSPQIVKQMVSKGAPLPSDPVEHAIYADAEANYEAQQKKQAAGGQKQNGDPLAVPDAISAQANAPAAGEMAAGDTMDSEAHGVAANQAAEMQPAGAAPAKGVKAGKALKHSKAVEAMTPEDVQAVLALTPDARYQKLLAMSPDESVGFREGLKPVQRLTLTQGMTPAQTEVVLAMQAPVRVVGAEALETRLLRDIDSNRQLQAVMADFWLNHFSVYVRKNQIEPYMLASYERDTILPHALGRFEDLLDADATSPAMMMYLDNWQSIGDRSMAAERVQQISAYRPNAAKLPKGINENYGRELMELHTLGVGGGYTQQDVIEVAKCFTGWTIDRPYQGVFGGAQARPAAFGRGRFGGGRQEQTLGKPGEFVYDPNRHEPGDKVVLGHTIKEDGMKEGLEVLHILATSPATARFVSTKLAVRFVSDTPPPAMIDRMVATWAKTDGNISAVLSTMFHSPEFFSPAVYRGKVKTPIEFMVSALRASDAQVVNPLPLVQAMERLGMPVFGMQTPNGYSWKADEWVSSNALISRMNFALVLAGGRLPGVRTDWPALLGDGGDSSAAATLAANPGPQTERQLEAILIGQPAAERTRETVLAQFNNPTAQQEAERNFNARPAAASVETAGGEDMAAGAQLVRAKATRKGRGGQGFDGMAGQPGTPLDTMAGLLLGSPDFQRR
jgi:uncharacterized protein (DUF1800 family)